MSRAQLVITATTTRQWVHQLVNRYNTAGTSAFAPRSRRPHCNARAVDPDIEDRIIRLRKTLTRRGLDAGAETSTSKTGRRRSRPRWEGWPRAGDHRAEVAAIPSNGAAVTRPPCRRRRHTGPPRQQNGCTPGASGPTAARCLPPGSVAPSIRVTYCAPSRLPPTRQASRLWACTPCSTADAWLEAGVHIKAVADLLGHSSISIRGDIYGHTSDDTARGAVNALSGALGL